MKIQMRRKGKIWEGDEGLLKVKDWSSEHTSVQRILRYYSRKTKSESTRNIVCDTLNRFLVHSSLDPISVLELSPENASLLVQDYIDSLNDKGQSVRTLNVSLAYLNQFFKVNGYKNGKALELERYHQPARYRKKKEYTPTPDEIVRMADFSGSSQYKAMILMLYTSGLRNSTLRALLVRDVIDEVEKFKRGELATILLRVYVEMKVLVPDACKSSIPYYSFMSQEASQALVKHIEERIRAYGDMLPDEPLFISTSTNHPAEIRRKTPIQKTTLGTAVKRAARKSGIPDWKYVSPKCLRTAFESALRNNGIDTKDQEFLMGHILPGSQDTYYDKTKENTLRNKYEEVDFFPVKPQLSMDLVRRQLVFSGRQFGLSEQRLAKLEEALRMERTPEGAQDIFEIMMNESKSEVRILQVDHKPENQPQRKIVTGDEDLLEALGEGWKIEHELNGNKYLLSYSFNH